MAYGIQYGSSNSVYDFSLHKKPVFTLLRVLIKESKSQAVISDVMNGWAL
jgi:hypothetical protein